MADNDDDLVDYDEEEVRLVSVIKVIPTVISSAESECLCRSTGSDLSGAGRILT
jgi:hypothetical protein